MTYVWSDTEPLKATVKYCGSCCKTQALRYAWAEIPFAGTSVYSYRGPKQRPVWAHVHDFERERYFVTLPSTALFTVSPGGYYDGINTFGVPHHPVTTPKIQKGFEFRDPEISLKKAWLAQELFDEANKPSFATATFLAEGLETVAYIANRLGTVARSIVSLYDEHKSVSTVRKAGKHVLSAHERWLEYRYAIMPVILDIENIIDTFTNSNRKLYVSRGLKKEETTSFSNHTFSLDNACVPYGQKPLVWRFKVATKTTLRGGGKMVLRPSYDPAKWGTSFYDVLMASWEVLPLSFVIDWFYDIGGWLASHRDAHISIVNNYVTVVQETEQEIWLDSADFTNIVDSGQIKTDYLYISRVTNTTPPEFPLYRAKTLSLLRRCDAAALSIGFIANILKRV